MPAQLTYPGVYIEEIPSGVRTIVGIATSITAFLGRAPRGPVNDPFIANSFGDFARTFGGLQINYPMSYAVRDFFLNGGSQAIIVRLIHPNADLGKGKNAFEAAKTVSDAAATGANANDAKDKAKTANDVIQNDANKSPEEKAAAKKVFDAVDAAVTAGKTLVQIKDAAKGTLPPDPATFAKKAALRLNTYSSSENRAFEAAKTVSDAVATGANANDAKDKAKTANDAIQNDANKSPEEKAAAKKVFDAVDAAVTAGKTLVQIKDAAKGTLPILPAPLVLEAASEGTWADTLRARVDYDNIDTVGDRYKPLTKNDLFNLTIRDINTGDTERFICVAVRDSSRALDKVLKKESRMVQVQGILPNSIPKESDDGISDNDKKIKLFSDEDKNKRSIGVVDSDKGFDGGNLDENDYTTGPGLEDKKWGLFALDKADLFNLLCIPPDVRSEDTDIGVYQTAEKYCQDRRALLIVDPPVAWGKNQATAASDAFKGLPGLGLTGVEGINAAVYFPRVKQTDPLSENQVDIFAPCGIIAGIMARTDTQRGVWKAPAGLDASLTGIAGLQVNLNDAENGMLNPMGINCLRDFGILGRVVWGARTLRGADQFADQWKYIPVRRTALFIEESLFRSLQWVVFEPNDEPLWAQIRLNVGAFMHDLFVQGAFQGTTPQQAYFVKCDKETTTQSDINKGIVNIVVGFAPLKPAEFVVIKLQQMAGQIQT